jgi:SAM-dependent methyltransferase
MKGTDSRALWDLKYEHGLPSLTTPDPFFVSAYENFVRPSLANPGIALDLAGGLGRHALWLADRKWRVTVVDVSAVAIGKLRKAADRSNVELDLLTLDTATYEFGSERFDLVVLFYHLDRSLFPKIMCSMNVGGFVICKMAISWGSENGAGTNQENPLAQDELPLLFSDLQVVDHHERPVRGRGVVEYVGRKSS